MWIPAEDQLADNTTKTQIATKSMPHVKQTLGRIADKVKGYKSKSNIVRNR